MKLNHINLGVSDVSATVTLFTEYFGLRPVKNWPSTDKMAFTNDDNDSLISVFKAKDVGYPKIFHVGFYQDSVEQVKALHEKLHVAATHPKKLKKNTADTPFILIRQAGL